MGVLLIIREILGYVLLAGGYMMIILLALVTYSNAVTKDWARLAYGAFGLAFGIAMIAKPTIQLFGL